MNFSYDDLQAVLAAWPDAALPHSVDDSLLDRICQVLAYARVHPDSCTWQGDLQPLLRHYLLRNSARAGKVLRLKVPFSQDWPTRNSWADHGIDAISGGDSAFLISAHPWHSEWLGAGDEGVFADAFTDNLVRRRSQCKADPFIKDSSGFVDYSSPGQREAVRGAFLMPEGDTLLVNLPTGSGKSLVGYAPTLVHREEGHLTIFVVPTVSLALDQERAMQRLFRQSDPTRLQWPLAWYGGLSKEERAGVRRRLRSGTQRILFTSPEALTTSLLGAVSDAAASGMLKYFVIDEAHLVTQWGDEFRPAFQALAGLRRSLMRTAPRGFRTLLMSATFTEETVDILSNLFGPPERVQMISAVHLRPEPQYWFHKAGSALEKEERVLEALRNAPRPFILYVTKRDEVARWGRLLRTTGLNRISTFDGGTPDTDRQRIIDDWAANRIDGIVATSAFGVGLDKNDVRTVIHATIPETLDRYYQEVGRGGRDGKPSVSLLVFDDTDWLLPKRLARPRIISVELGFGRWKAMFQSRRATSDESLWDINIDAVRKGLPGGSEHNVNWNMRTLILMARAGLIALEVEANRAEQEYEPGEDASSLLAALANVRVRILNDGHLVPDIWERAVSASRLRTLTAATRNLDLMRGLLPIMHGSAQEIGREVGETLAQLYRIDSGPWSVQVSQVCGGCQRDRFQPGRDEGYAAPVVVPIHRVGHVQNNVWLGKFPWIDPAFAYVFYDESHAPEVLRNAVLQFAEWLVHSCGVLEICAPPESTLASSAEWFRLYQHTGNRVLLHRSMRESDMEPYSPLARLTLLDPDATCDQLSHVQMLQRPFHVVLLPLAMTDPGNPLRRLVDVTRNKMRLEKSIFELTL
jgi:ATP-dependent DNA helicase RecQ